MDYEWEDEDDEENNKPLYDIFKIYKRPFSVVNRDIYTSNILRYSNVISNID